MSEVIVVWKESHLSGNTAEIVQGLEQAARAKRSALKEHLETVLLIAQQII